MITKIKNALKNNSNVSAYAIEERQTESTELFYVKKNLQTNRAANYTEWSVTVYVDKDGLRGQSSFKVDPYFDEKILEEKVNEAVESALLSLNRPFDIPSPTNDEIKENTSNLKDEYFPTLMTKLVPAIFRADCFENGSLNATEVFLYKYNIHFINSNGVDLKFCKFKGNIELIPSFTDGKDKYEVYKMVEFSSLDTNKVTEEINDAMKQGLDRSKAAPLKLDGKKVKVLIPASELSSYFNYFKFKLGYQAIFSHMSNVKIGDYMLGDSTGDKFTLTLTPMLDSSANSSPVDGDGVVLNEVTLMKDGYVTNYSGSYQFGKWLGIEKPTGNLRCTKVSAGSKAVAEMKAEPYIECVKFSGIQMDPFTGFFGGEVRLGYYFDGTKVIPVTGFAISGNIEEIKQKAIFSKEIKGSGDYEGPAYMETDLFKIN